MPCQQAIDSAHDLRRAILLSVDSSSMAEILVPLGCGLAALGN
jgi:hypothetical protein